MLTFMPYLLSVGIEIATEVRGYSHVSGHKKSPGRLGLGRIFPSPTSSFRSLCLCPSRSLRGSDFLTCGD